MTLGMVILFFLLMICGMPLFAALLVTALAGFAWIGDLSLLRIMVQQFFGGMDLFSLMAIPFFIFAGTLMDQAGMTERLLHMARALVGHLRGGVGYVNVVGSIIFAGINGSAAADTSALGTVLIPAMERDGYDRSYAAGLTAGSSLIGPIIPPSIFMILYAALTRTSVGGLFLAGVVPGLILGLAFMAMNYFHARSCGISVAGGAFSFSGLATAVGRGMSALVAPFIIIGGIVFGVMTPTESGAVAAAYVAVAGVLWTRELTLAGFWSAVFRTVRLTSSIFLIMGAAAVIGWLMAWEQVPQEFAARVMPFVGNKILVLALLSLVTFFVGMFMEEVATLVLLTPVFLPIAKAAQIDPLVFGIVMILNITIALITPPMGACVYIAAAVGNVPLTAMFRRIWPFVACAMGVVMLMIIFPGLILLIPRAFGF
ncbi:MAG: TRAP transporter large permease [Desulfobacter sp.]